jgi:uncharacterized protein (TIGR02186 family)
MTRRGRIAGLVTAGLVVATMVLIALAGVVEAQQRRQRAQPVPVPQPPPRVVPQQPAKPEATPEPPPPREMVTADVSTRRVAVTSSFTGIEIVIFGAVDNSRQPSAESGYYDLVVVVEGTPTRLVARRKDRLLGMWLNTDSLTFRAVPSYYAIATSRPLDEIAPEDVLRNSGIGFDYVPMVLGREAESRSPEEIKRFREAVVRLKRREKLYTENEYGAVFIGRSLFRASVDVPANVTVGPFDTRVYLFRNGELLSRYVARLNLEREGAEQLIYEAAFRYPLLYGIGTVALAMLSGLLASTLFRKGAH